MKCIVVLSYGTNWFRPLSPIDKERIEKGIEPLKKNSANFIVFAGNSATAAAEYAKKCGVGVKKIRTECKSFDTLTNAWFVKKYILDPNSWRDIIVVTSDFHIPKTKYIFRKVFGRKYRIRFVAVKTSGKDREKLIEGERQALKHMKKLLHKVKPSDELFISCAVLKRMDEKFTNLI